MRAIGFAALSFGAVIALSATLGMSYRSDASPLDDPSTAVTDSSSPAVTDSSPATPAPDDPGTPAADGGGVFFQPFAFQTPPPTAGDGSVPAVSYQYGPGRITLNVTPTGSAQYAQTLLYTWSVDEGFSRIKSCPLGIDEGGGQVSFGDPGPQSCTYGDDETPLAPGIYNPDSQQGDAAQQPTGGWVDDYFAIPEAPTIDDAGTDLGSVDLFGTGVPGDSVTVLVDGSTPVCADVTVDERGDWFCTTPPQSFTDHDFSAFQIDQGAGRNDQILDYDPEIRYLPGGESALSDPTTVTVQPIPSLSYLFQPGGVQATADFGGSQATEGETDLGVEGDGFERQVQCAWPGTDPSSNHASVCTFTGIDPGDRWLESYQQTPVDEGFDDSERVVAYFVVPDAPAIASTLNSNRTVTFTGAGAVPGDKVHVVNPAGAEACGAPATVGSDGAWSCTTPVQAAGAHSWRAVQQDATTCADPDSNFYCDVYISGALSAYSSVVSATVHAAPGSSTIPEETPAPTDWTFTVTGIDLNNVHPGDTFTVTGSGLPPGSTISGELHSKAVSIGSAVVQPDGSFSLPVTVPADFPAGAHTIVMTLTPPGSVPLESTQPLKVVEAAVDSGGSTDPSAAAEDNSSPIGGAEEPGIDNHGPNSNILTHGLDSIADVLAHPAKIPAAIEIGLVLLIFAVLPGHLLNATLAEQYERFTRRRSQPRRAPGRWARFVAFLHRAPFVAGLALTTVTALLFGFADPRFGFSLASLRLFLGLAIALAVVSYLTNAVVGRIMRGRWKVDVEVNLRPLGLILTVVGVVVSRLLDFSPGFLIGLVLGLVISEKHLAKQAWRAVLLRSSILLGLALLAWLAFSLFDASEEGGTFASELAVETLVAITTEAVVGLLVELLPLKLLEGEKLFQKSKVLWGALYLLAVFIFVVAVVPWEGNWAQLGSSLWTWLGIVVGFGIVATGVYLYFRIRGHEELDEHEITDADEDKLVPIASEDD